jgi:hypothetical protein
VTRHTEVGPWSMSLCRCRFCFVSIRRFAYGFRPVFWVTGKFETRGYPRLRGALGAVEGASSVPGRGFGHRGRSGGGGPPPGQTQGGTRVTIHSPWPSRRGAPEANSCMSLVLDPGVPCCFGALSKVNDSASGIFLGVGTLSPPPGPS